MSNDKKSEKIDIIDIDTDIKDHTYPDNNNYTESKKVKHIVNFTIKCPDSKGKDLVPIRKGAARMYVPLDFEELAEVIEQAIESVEEWFDPRLDESSSENSDNSDDNDSKSE